MAESVDNIVLEQLRSIREEIKDVKAPVVAVDLKLEDLSVRIISVEGIMFGLGGYIRSIIERAGYIETKLGI